jgi:putative spermidine/putrescine transport system substrate-binding protein
MMIFTRRSVVLGGGALGLAAAMPMSARASGSMTAAIYPGTWDEAYRAEVAPRLREWHGIDVAFDPLWAVDQLAKARAARGVAPFDAFVLDPGPAAQGLESDMFEPIDASLLSNAGKLPAGMVTQHGVTVNAQIVGIVYNPTRFDAPPTRWEQLFEEPYVSRLGLTGFQTTFGTVSLIEMAKALGGSATDVEPVFAKLAEVLPKVAAVAAPAALPSLFQQGEIDLMYTNTQNVATLRGRGVDIAFQAPESGAITFGTTLHIVKGAENVEAAHKYIDTAISAEVQTALMQAPYNLLPVNTDVALDGSLPIKSLDELAGMVTHDWSVINPQRAAWIERFNREMTK